MGSGINITYETLFDILRNEKNREELQQLDKNFFDDLVQYINDKKQLLVQKPDSELFANVEREKAAKQIENIKKLVKELYERREKKILNLALISSRTSSLIDKSNLLEEENQLFDAFVKLLDKYRIDILHSLIKAQLPSISKQSKEPAPKSDRDTKLVRFIKPVPKFVGKELEVYGPFEEEDIANLPFEIAELLISKGRAEEMQG